jgi:Sigma-70, region 4
MADDAVLAENVSIALLRVLETLGPVERTVFVLDEVFETPFDEIAEVVGKTPAAVRQIASRSGCTKATHRDRDGGGLLGSRCGSLRLGGDRLPVQRHGRRSVRNGWRRHCSESLVIDHGRISRIYAMRNPNKLGHLEEVAELRR